MTSYDLQESVLTLRCGEAAVRIEATDQHIVRIRLAPTGKFGRDFSWAVLDTGRKGRLSLVSEDESRVVVSTGSLSVVVHRNPCRLEVHDSAGHVLTADDADRGMAWRTRSPRRGDTDSALPPSAPVQVWQTLDDGIAIYGLGEKTGPLNKRGRSWTMWNTDAYGYGPSRDSIYK